MIAEIAGFALLWFGIALAVLGVLGMCRSRDLYARIKFMSLVNGLAAASIHLSSVGLVPPEHGFRGVLTALLFLLSGPALAHALALTAHRTGAAAEPGRDDPARDTRGQPSGDRG